MGKKFEIQKIYPLTPMQEGILFHYLRDQGRESYFEQTSFDIKGSLDIDTFNQSYHLLFERYDILRTIFKYHKIERPIQIVLKERDVALTFDDISALNQEAQALYLEEFLRQDRRRGFDLSKDVLMRMSVLKKGQEIYRIVWSYQHIIMDGWCLGIILKDFLEIYSALSQKRQALLEKTYPYSDYIHWLEKYDKEAAALYWAKHLEGYENAAAVPQFTNIEIKNGFTLAEVDFNIDPDLTEGLETIAKEHHVTVNILFQTIWGVHLAKIQSHQ